MDIHDYNKRSPILLQFYDFVRKVQPDLLYMFAGRISFEARDRVKFNRPYEQHATQKQVQRMEELVIAFVDSSAD